jgi:hypothetical protein
MASLSGPARSHCALHARDCLAKTQILRIREVRADGADRRAIAAVADHIIEDGALSPQLGSRSARTQIAKEDCASSRRSTKVVLPAPAGPAMWTYLRRFSAWPRGLPASRRSRSQRELASELLRGEAVGPALRRDELVDLLAHFGRST